MSHSLIKVRIKMIEMGIAPAITGRELSKMLSTMSEVDRKLSNRKFRKLWRKISKKDPSLRNIMSLNSEMSDKAIRRNRCVIVTDSIIQNSNT